MRLRPYRREKGRHGVKLLAKKEDNDVVRIAEASVISHGCKAGNSIFGNERESGERERERKKRTK